MANQKYNNLTALLTSGRLNWAADAIMAYLFTGASFDATDVKVTDVGGSRLAQVPITRRSVGEDGSLLGGAVSFGNMPGDVPFQMVIGKDFGPGVEPEVIAFYNTGDNNEPLTIKNAGTLIVRPEQSLPAEDTGQGTWVKI
jgi:hypothetical protein